MADWAGQLIMAQRQVTEIEQKVARQQQAVEQLRLQGAGNVTVKNHLKVAEECAHANMLREP